MNTLNAPIRARLLNELCRDKKKWLVVLSLALLVLFAYFIRYHFWLGFGGLEENYIAWAAQHYFGGLTPGYTSCAAAIAKWDFSGGACRTYPAGYSLVILLGDFVGFSDLQSFRLFQMGLDSLGVILIFALCRNLGCNVLISLVAGFGYAVGATWAFGSTFVLAESVVPVLVVLVLFLMSEARERDKYPWWILVGFSAGFLAIIRTELSVLILPIAVFAAFASAPNQKARHALAAGAGFLAVWLSIATANLVLLDRFHIANSVIYYAFYSGLGQIDNAYGYVVSDVEAHLRLAAVGISYHSPESEEYWRDVYFNAWLEHPLFVLEGIWHRFTIIALKPEWLALGGWFTHGTQTDVYKGGFIVLMFVSVYLVVVRRYTDAMLVAGSLVVALGTLGLIYVEPRYVRYAAISYILATAVFAQIAANLVVSKVRPPVGLARGGIVMGLAVLAAFFAYGLMTSYLAPLQSIALKGVGRYEKNQFLESNELSGAFQPVLDIRPAAGGSRIEPLPDGAYRIRGSDTISGYQGISMIMPPIPSILELRYEIDTRDDVGYLGILSGDQSNFIVQKQLTQGEVSVGEVTAYITDEEVFSVVSSIETGVVFDVKSLEYRFVCLGEHSNEQPGIFSSIFGQIYFRPKNLISVSCDE